MANNNYLLIDNGEAGLIDSTGVIPELDSVLKENNAQLIQQVSDLQFKLTNAESEINSLHEQLHKQQEMFLIKLGKMAYNMFD